MSQENQDDNLAEYEIEMEMLQAMYTPEELVVNIVEDDDHTRALVSFTICLERALVELRTTLPIGFPLMKPPSKFQVVRSRGLVDSQETELIRQLLGANAQVLEEQGRYSLVGLLLRAKDYVEELNESGAMCAVCLCRIQADDRDVFTSRQCWHVYHIPCIAAWWKQLEARGKGKGGQLAKEALFQQQALQDALGNERERQAAVLREQAVLERFSEQRTLLKEYQQWCQAKGGTDKGSGNLDEEIPDRFRILYDTGLAQQGFRGLANIEASIKTQENAVKLGKQKLAKASQDKLAVESSVKAASKKATLRGLDCTACKTPIPYEDIEPFIESAVERLCISDPENSTSSAGGGLETLAVYLPQGWANQALLGQDAVEFQLSEQEIDRLREMQKERERLFKLQQERSGQALLLQAQEQTQQTNSLDGENALQNKPVASGAHAKMGAPSPPPPPPGKPKQSNKRIKQRRRERSKNTSQAPKT